MTKINQTNQTNTKTATEKQTLTSLEQLETIIDKEPNISKEPEYTYTLAQQKRLELIAKIENAIDTGVYNKSIAEAIESTREKYHELATQETFSTIKKQENPIAYAIEHNTAPFFKLKMQYDDNKVLYADYEDTSKGFNLIDFLKYLDTENARIVLLLCNRLYQFFCTKTQNDLITDIHFADKLKWKDYGIKTVADYDIDAIMKEINLTVGENDVISTKSIKRMLEKLHILIYGEQCRQQFDKKDACFIRDSFCRLKTKVEHGRENSKIQTSRFSTFIGNILFFTLHTRRENAGYEVEHSDAKVKKAKKSTYIAKQVKPAAQTAAQEA